MSFQAFCPECKKTVTADFIANSESEVMHLSSEGDNHDHRWVLNRPDRQRAERFSEHHNQTRPRGAYDNF